MSIRSWGHLFNATDDAWRAALERELTGPTVSPCRDYLEMWRLCSGRHNRITATIVALHTRGGASLDGALWMAIREGNVSLVRALAGDFRCTLAGTRCAVLCNVFSELCISPLMLPMLRLLIDEFPNIMLEIIAPQLGGRAPVLETALLPITIEAAATVETIQYLVNERGLSLHDNDDLDALLRVNERCPTGFRPQNAAAIRRFFDTLNAARAERGLAIASAQHRRLGAAAELRQLPPDVLRNHIWPHVKH